MRLKPGTYREANSAATPGKPRLTVSCGACGGCAGETGYFIIHDIEYGEGKNLKLVEVSFEQKCSGSGLIRGRFRYEPRS
ncbi:MAG: hypothetical protein K1Y36_06450 [Blastocatellia bacterium]|nr:hypothetical protein [Blastocatellia bacterium]